MRVNNLLQVITYATRKWHCQDLNLRPTDPETDTLATEPARFMTHDHWFTGGWVLSTEHSASGYLASR